MAPSGSGRRRPSEPARPTDVDLGRLERLIRADCTGFHTGEPTSGAQAIWRDGRARYEQQASGQPAGRQRPHPGCGSTERHDGQEAN